MAAKPSDYEAAAYVVTKINELLVENCTAIAACRGKHLIVLLGPSGHGKSVTTNAIRYGPLKKLFDKQKKCTVFVLRDDCPFSITKYGFAQGGDGKRSCTKMPYPYLSPESIFGEDTFVLDTRGAFDSDNEPFENIAATLLMRFAMEQARSVRLVVVLDASQTIQKQDLGLNLFSELFGDFISNDNAPIVFVFNRFTPHPDDEETKQTLEDLGKDLPRKYDYIMQQLKDCCSETFNSKQQSWEGTIRSIFERVRKTRGGSANYMDDPDYKKQIDSQRFLRQLALAFGIPEIKRKEAKATDAPQTPFCSTVCYLDPMDAYSIEKVRDAIRTLPPFDMKYMHLEKYCLGIEDYEEKMRTLCLPRYSSLLDVRSVLSRYSRNTIQSLLVNRRKDLDRHEANIPKADLKSDTLIAEYAEELQVKCRRLEAMKKQSQKLDNEAKMMESEIEVMKTDPREIQLAHYHWSRVSYDDVNTVEYKGRIPYIRVEERLTPPTRRYKTIADESPKFHVQYIAGSTAAKIGATIIFPLRLMGVGETLSEGDVTIYGSRRDYVDFDPQIRERRMHITRIRHEIHELLPTIDAMTESSEADLKHQIIRRRDEALHDIDYLMSFGEFETELETVYNNFREEMEAFSTVVQTLYGESELYETYSKQFAALQQFEAEADSNVSVESVWTVPVETIKNSLKQFFVLPSH